MQINFVLLTLWVAGFLFVLNIILAIIFRKQSKREVLSYCAVCVLELMVFVFALFYQLGTLSQIPIHFPSGLPFNSIQTSAALAFGLGLFPAAYWHRTNLSDLPKRIAEDASTMKGQQAGVRIRKPGEWIN